MERFRKYGVPPYRVVLVHGGPGAAGEMAPVARELAPTCGVLEPWQTGTSVPEQVKELGTFLEDHADVPSILVGFSWGAWLSCLVTTKYPRLVKKLILISSGGFKPSDAQQVEAVRTERMSPGQKEQVRQALARLQDTDASTRHAAMADLGKVYQHVDAYDPLPDTGDAVQVNADIFQGVWPEAAELRRSGRLLDAVKSIACPVVALHGEHDPHPASGVEEPLRGVLSDFKMIRLAECGHVPWLERKARLLFFRHLRAELGDAWVQNKD